MQGTGKEVSSLALTALARQGGYIFGQSGATWSSAKQKNIETRYKSDPEKYSDYKFSAQYGARWIGHPVWDCSGLCRWALKQLGLSIAHGSNSIWKRWLSQKGKLVNGMNLPEGAAVFTGNDAQKPHIGIYTGDGMVTEAAGAKTGVIQSKLHGSKWTYWGLFKGVEYDFSPEVPAAITPPAITHPTLRKGAKGTHVRQMQQLLMKAGEVLPVYGADGDFGTETLKAVKAFQRKNELTADGICGPKTWAELVREGDDLS